MPGITGRIGALSAGAGHHTLFAMHQCMLHEPFYSHGTYSDEENGVQVGYVALAGSLADCMPIQNGDKTITLFVSGECHLDSNECEGLEGDTKDCDPNSPRAIVFLYEKHGPEVLARLNGWISGLLIDARCGRVFLFNDRFGLQRIYYHQNDEAFYFSSEAKSLLEVLPGLRVIDAQSAGEYLRYDCVLANRTLFKGIELLPPGSAWTFERGRLVRRTAFDPAQWENQAALSEGEFSEAAQAGFSRAVHRCFRGDPVALALTGGLDTRLVLAARKPMPGRLPCFTFTGACRESFDVRLARTIAYLAGQDHRTIVLGQEFLDDYPAQVERAIYMTDGQADVTTAGEVYLNRMARKLTPVKLTGKFGSQVLGNVQALRDRSPEDGFTSPEFMPYCELAAQTFKGFRRLHPMTQILFREIPWYWSRYQAAEMAELTVRSPFLDLDLMALCYRVPDEVRTSRRFHFDWIARWWPELARVRTNAGRYGMHTPPLLKAAELWYRGINMASKAYSWDRLPHGLHHAVARVDRPFAHLGLQRVLMGWAGFVHYRTWFRQQLAGYVRDLLLDKRTLERPYWDAAVLRRMVRDHLEGRANYLVELRKAMTLELIHRTLLEQRRSLPVEAVLIPLDTQPSAAAEPAWLPTPAGRLAVEMDRPPSP